MSRDVFESALAALRGGAHYSLSGLTLTVNDIPMAITDEEFDQVWDILNELEGDDFVLRLQERRMSDTTERGPTSGLLREFATALDKDRGHSRSMVTRVMRDAADDIDALAAELAAAEKRAAENACRRAGAAEKIVALEKRNEELERLARRLLEDPWVDVSSVAEKNLTVAESEMRAYLAAASEGKP